MAAIVRVFPRFTNIPSRNSQKWIDFCWSELLLYKPFCNIQRDIGIDDTTIVSNWESLNYNPWHVDRGTIENEFENNVQTHDDFEDENELPNNQNIIEQ